MLDFLFRGLARFTDLTSQDRERIKALAWRVQHVAAHTNLAREGDDPHSVNVVLNGWAYRYKQLSNGRRQILALLVPGDMCDPCVFLLEEMSHSLATLTPSTILRVPEREMMALLDEHPHLKQAFWIELMVSAEVQREWTVSLGCRTAAERMAHLFCELLLRLEAVGLATASECDIPITQAELGEALGLSTVHVNRTLQELRSMKLLELRGKRLRVTDIVALQEKALFNPNYLHLSFVPPAAAVDKLARH